MNDSILLIQSQDSTNNSMGTGFVVHQDEFGSYVLTCAHVIEQVGKAKISDYEVVVKAIGTSQTLDLALLYVQKLYREPLKLQVKKLETIDVHLIGYSLFNKIKYQKKSREATILTQVNLENRNDNQIYQSWQIIAKDHNEIEAGNSGGPLICSKSGKVIGVVSNNKGVKQGYAVAIEHLLDIWLEDVPFLLIENKNNEETPFVGLSAFSIKEAHLFFGRGIATKEILEKLQENNLVAVVGESGSGKSSLIKAGVIPKYLNGALRVEADDNFHLLTIRPAENAFMELSDTIGRISKVLKLDFKDINEIQKSIEERDNLSILNACKHLFHKEEKATLLIYIDQFEELFTSRMEKESNENSFIELLLYFLEHQSESSQFKIKIIFTIRADYYDPIADHKTFSILVKENRYDLKRMKKEEIRECIEKPLERTYIDRAEITPFANAVIDNMDDNPHELTLLQIALNETWNNRSSYNNNLLQTYHEIGEVSGALSALAESTWNSLEASEKKILQYVFIRIIKPSDIGGATKRSAERNEFSDDAWRLAKKLTLSLDKRGNSSNSKSAKLGRLLKIRTHKDNEVLELMHEILARKWSRYRRWLIAVNRNSLRKVHDGVIVKSHHYFKGKKDKGFLLTGYELEESLKLVRSEYKKYLSDNEVEFIKKSSWNEKRNSFMKKGAILALLVLLGLSGYFYSQVEASSKKVTDFLIKTTASTISFLEIKDKNRKYKAIKENFDAIVKEFEESSNPIEHQLVVKAKLGQAIVLKALNKKLEAVDAYTNLIESEWDNVESEEFVAKALYNRSKLYAKVNESNKSKEGYEQLIERFKNSQNPIILETVVQGWMRKGRLSKVLLENERVAILSNLIEHFKRTSNSKVKQELANAYNEIVWIHLLNQEYSKAYEEVKKGLQLEVSNGLKIKRLLNINLAHMYYLTNQQDKAKKIYLKYLNTKYRKEVRKTLKDDFRDLKMDESFYRKFVKPYDVAHINDIAKYVNKDFHSLDFNNSSSDEVLKYYEQAIQMKKEKQ